MQPKTMIECLHEVNCARKEFIFHVSDLFKIPDILEIIAFVVRGRKGEQ